MLELVPIRTCLTSAALMSFSRIKRIISVMPGCVSDPDGCGLMETPGSAKVQGDPSLSMMAPAS